MIKSRAWIPLIFGALVLFVPLFVLAQSGDAQSGLVPCSGIDCQACHIVDLIQYVINFFIGLSIPIAVGLFAWAGVLYFTSAANPRNIDKAKSIFKSAFIGFIIALGGYLIVETVLHAVLAPEFWAGWNEIRCTNQDRPTDKTLSDLLNNVFRKDPPPQPAPQSPSTGGGATGNGAGGGGGVVVGGPAGTCDNCVEIGAFAVKPGAGVQVDYQFNLLLSKTALQLQAAGISPDTMQVTEAYPPTRNHQNSCHYNGTCVDMNCIGGCSVSQINSFQAAASAAGGCAVYETYAGQCPAGVTGKCLGLSSGQISAPHFSVYSDPNRCI